MSVLRVFLVTLALGLGLTVASLGIMQSASVPGASAFIEQRGWPFWYYVSLSDQVDTGVRERFETQWLPSMLEDAWRIGSASGLYFIFDWAALSLVSALLVGSVGALRRSRTSAAGP